ncbi:hypothetical protein B0G69_4479 [Paraburkholderia sp. RAU2J]|nr:hypothetical protein B0G69_4479 [Paraburkholderia sp. RAU2J]
MTRKADRGRVNRGVQSIRIAGAVATAATSAAKISWIRAFL